MSIVALKKKTNAQYKNMSSGVQQFSLNGTHRSQGYVGQTSLSRSLPRTLAKGNTLRGYGGTDGHFYLKPSVLSGVTSTEDSNVVKPSVLSNNGMISTQYRWIERPRPFVSVKPDNNHNTNTQQYYIRHLREINTKKEITSTPVLVIPSAPVITKVEANSETTAIITFTEPSSGGSAITKYEYSTDSENDFKL